MNHPPFHIPEELNAVARIFAKAGFQCWLVGGAVRDGLLGRESGDCDLATDATPKRMMRLFHRTIPTGIKHGTITILMKGWQFETTTFRRDGDYTDGRRPDEVIYSDDIHEDLARRDFTINAIAWDLIHHRLLDPHDGRGDLEKRIIRAIGVPGERFTEDALRSIRACRFASQLGFTVEEETLAAIAETLADVPGLSAERIWEELKKILLSPAPSTALNLFKRTGLLKLIVPELDACAGVTQRGLHVRDVFDHSLTACDAVPAETPALRAAALLHDIGKPVVRRVNEDGESTFYGHETVGARMSEAIMTRLKASNAEKDRVVRLVRHHMFHYQPEWSNAAVRRFMSRVGLDLWDNLVALRLADEKAISPEMPSSVNELREFKSRIDKVLESQAALSIRDLAVNGRDLMKALKIQGSPKLGLLLEHLLDCVLEDPDINTPQVLTARARVYWTDLSLSDKNGTLPE